MTEPTGEFLLFESEDGRTRIECCFAGESLWLSQALMAELFQTTKQNIAKHLKAIFADGKNYRVTYYSLDAILAVSYRVRSALGTQFRRWATERLAAQAG